MILRLSAVKEMIGNADIEIIESRGLHKTALHDFAKGRYTVTNQRVLENVEVRADGSGAYSAVLGNVVIVDYLAICESRNFKKALEGIQIAHKSFFLDFLF